MTDPRRNPSSPTASTSAAASTESFSRPNSPKPPNTTKPEVQHGFSPSDPNLPSVQHNADQAPQGVPARDEEKGESGFGSSRDKSTTADGTETKDIVVGWDGPDDPENPRNWPTSRKWTATLVVSGFALMSTISTSMVAPCTATMAADFGITSQVEEELMLSLFVLAYAFGPLIIAPLSEVYGRVRLLQIPNLFFIAFNLACGFAQNKTQLMIFRFLAGVGGSAPIAIGGGTLADVWAPEQRGLSVSIYSLAPLLGPAIGPIAGAWIIEKTTWRWVFWSTTIADGLVQVLGLFALRESFAPLLLKRKAQRLNEGSDQELYKTASRLLDQSVASKLGHAIIRPSKMLLTQPIVQAMSVYMAFLYGTLYLMLATFSSLWTDVYGESIGIGGLNYISLGIGLLLGAQIPARLNDVIYRRLKARNAGVATPEFRLPLLIPGSILVPIGLFIYGWSAQSRVHWIVPNLGGAIICAGVICCMTAMQTYVIEAYTTFAASAVSAVTVLRSLAGFGFPLFAPAMYAKLHYGWGNSVLGLVSVVLGLPAPWLLWVYGPALRRKSRFAAG